MKKLVFISHITEEKEIAMMLKDFIEKAFIGLIDVFVSSDEQSVSLGQKWLDGITESLRNCSVEIVVCSKISVKRPWINFEAGAGWVRNIPVIPLCHSGTAPDSLPMPLNLLQGAKASAISEMKLLLPVLANAIGSAVPSYDFTDFVENIKRFEKRYTFWDECNRCFSVLKKYAGEDFSALTSGNPIQFYVVDIEKETFYKIIPFLKTHNLVDCAEKGKKIGADGTFSIFTVTPLSDLLSTIKADEFTA